MGEHLQGVQNASQWKRASCNPDVWLYLTLFYSNCIYQIRERTEMQWRVQFTKLANFAKDSIASTNK